MLSRLKTHVFPLLGARAVVDLDTFDLMQPLEAIKKRGTINVALRVHNYLQSIMRDAKRLRLIIVNPAYDLEGFISAPRITHRPALPLPRLPELMDRIRELQRAHAHSADCDVVASCVCPVQRTALRTLE